MDAPIFITEMGGLLTGLEPKATAVIDELLAEVESDLGSWAWWEYKSYDDVTTAVGGTESFYDADGELKVDTVRRLARTYARAVAADLSASAPLAQAFAPDTGEYRLSFVPVAGGISEVYVNREWHYPGGIEAGVEPAGAAEVSDDGKSSVVEIRAREGSDVDGAAPVVTVTLRPRKE
mmetsp:Transcript_10032/g.32904  ORF Transcript_10032/g.32904 Transcript_10032/m.32904 type:complete len:178 (-) Transcript_10032:522-1055(-)